MGTDERERRQAIAELHVLYGLLRGLSGKDDARSEACRNEYAAKFRAELARASVLGIGENPEVKWIEIKVGVLVRSLRP